MCSKPLVLCWFFDTFRNSNPLRGRAGRVQGECKDPKSQVGPPWAPPIIKTELRTYNFQRHIVVVVIVAVVVVVVVIVVVVVLVVIVVAVAVAVVVDPIR